MVCIWGDWVDHGISQRVTHSRRLNFMKLWRRRRDSNPRDDSSPTPLAGERLRPLGHVSTDAYMHNDRGVQDVVCAFAKRLWSGAELVARTSDNASARSSCLFLWADNTVIGEMTVRAIQARYCPNQRENTLAFEIRPNLAQTRNNTGNNCSISAKNQHALMCLAMPMNGTKRISLGENRPPERAAAFPI